MHVVICILFSVQFQLKQKFEAKMNTLGNETMSSFVAYNNWINMSVLDVLQVCVMWIGLLYYCQLYGFRTWNVIPVRIKVL